MRTENPDFKLRRLRVIVLCAWIGGIWSHLTTVAFAAPAFTPAVTVTHTGDACLRVVGVQADVGTTSVTVRGRVSRSRITTVLSMHELEIGIFDAAGNMLLSERRTVGPLELPRRNSQMLVFSVTLPHVPQTGEKIVVNLGRAKT